MLKNLAAASPHGPRPDSVRSWAPPMLSFTRLFALVILGALATSETLLAQTAADTASSWGLLGTWRFDCSNPVSRSNSDTQYVVRAGKLFEDREFGDKRDSSPIISATTKADGSIEIVVDFVSTSETRQYSLMKGSDGRIRAMASRNVETNKYTIVDGKFKTNGSDTRWLTRCR